MLNALYAFGVSLLTMTVLDGAWLGFIAPKFYKQHIGFIMTSKPNWFAAAAFYVLFIVGVTVFVTYPGWKNDTSLLHVALLGALFGLVTYATYDLTNQATLKNWPAIVTLVDMLWGMTITAVVSVVTVTLLRHLVQ